MYTNHSIAFQVAQDRQRDMLAQAERERRARRARRLAGSSQPAASRRSRRAWQLVPQLRAQAQS